MINYYDFLQLINNEETTHEKYHYSCYGPNVAIEEWWNQKYEDGGCSISVVYDTRSFTVYEMEAWDYQANREYRWINPLYREAYNQKYRDSTLDVSYSIDGREFIDLEVSKDILEKATAMFQGKEYDTRIMIPVDLPDDVMFNIMKMAHEADMTLNQFVEQVVRADLERRNKELTKEAE